MPGYRDYLDVCPTSENFVRPHFVGMPGGYPWRPVWPPQLGFDSAKANPCAQPCCAPQVTEVFLYHTALEHQATRQGQRAGSGSKAQALTSPPSGTLHKVSQLPSPMELISDSMSQVGYSMATTHGTGRVSVHPQRPCIHRDHASRPPTAPHSLALPAPTHRTVYHSHTLTAHFPEVLPSPAWPCCSGCLPPCYKNGCSMPV